VAQKVQVTLVDDLDGSSADETLTFGLDGVAYEIDLSRSNAKKFRDSLNAYVGAARRSGRSARAGRPRGRTGRRAAAGSQAPTSDIRAWARSKGIKVNERGRISADVVAKYEAAH
jgi:nucleoid-associated protein Lsr2